MDRPEVPVTDRLTSTDATAGLGERQRHVFGVNLRKRDSSFTHPRKSGYYYRNNREEKENQLLFILFLHFYSLINLQLRIAEEWSLLKGEA